MAIKICGSVDRWSITPGKDSKSSTQKAEEYFKQAKKYLTSSKTAMRVFELVEKYEGDIFLVVNVTKANDNLFLYPKSCTGNKGCQLWPGLNASKFYDSKKPCSKNLCVYWSPLRNVTVEGKFTSFKGWKKVLAGHQWFQFKNAPNLMMEFRSKFGLVPTTLKFKKASKGTLTAPILLIHEMGHLLQYILDTKDTLKLAQFTQDRTKPPLDVLNVATIENAVCLELLKAKKKKVGIRWLYSDVIKDEKPNDDWTKNTGNNGCSIM